MRDRWTERPQKDGSMDREASTILIGGQKLFNSFSPQLFIKFSIRPCYLYPHTQREYPMFEIISDILEFRRVILFVCSRILKKPLNAV
jgi:hypothetical protein